MIFPAESSTSVPTYFLVCFLTLGACILGSWAAVKHPRLALGATVSVFLLFLFNRLISESGAQQGQPLSLRLFDLSKALSVLFTIILLALANLWLARTPGRAVPRGVARFFSVILCLNILETTLLAANSPSLNSGIYAVAAAALAVATLWLPWEMRDGVLGFSDRAYVLCFLACLSYLYLFLSLPGSGWIAWLVLLIPYLPASRTGHLWIAYRAYSVWIFLSFAHALGLIHFYRTPPAVLTDFMVALRGSALNEVILALAVASVFYLGYVRLIARRTPRRPANPPPAVTATDPARACNEAQP